MKLEKLNLFKVINVFMVVFCACTMWMNGIGVRVVNSGTAVSSMNGTNFEYETLNDSIVFKKDGKWTGSLPTNKKLSIRNDNLFFQSNAVIVLGKITAAVAAGGLAAAGPAAIAGLQEVLCGAFATAAASVTIPGELAVEATLAGAVEATLAGAGEATLAGAGEAAAAAAAADAAIAAGGVGALMSAFVVPVLVAAGVGAGVM